MRKTHIQSAANIITRGLPDDCRTTADQPPPRTNNCTHTHTHTPTARSGCGLVSSYKASWSARASKDMSDQPTGKKLALTLAFNEKTQLFQHVDSKTTHVGKSIVNEFTHPTHTPTTHACNKFIYAMLPTNAKARRCTAECRNHRKAWRFTAEPTGMLTRGTSKTCVPQPRALCNVQKQKHW